jgi:hypothetical protein
MYEGVRKNVNQQEMQELENQKRIYDEIESIFPALQKYKAEHTKTNLQKLCVEIAEFCRSVYASTQNQEEREVYFAMLDKLKSK